MFSTHSPGSYDRAAIVVSPNPLALPAWGDRVYSPSTGAFQRDNSTIATQVASPLLNKPVVSAAALGEEVVVMAPPKAKNIKAKSQARRAKFEENLASSNGKALPREINGMTRSITQFPRSPYPSAPLSPFSPIEVSETVRPQRAASVSGTTSGVRKIKANRPAALGIVGSELSLAQNASTPSRPSFLSPVAESPAAPLDSSRLSQDFWRSVSVSEEIAAEQAEQSTAAAEAEGPETPVSAVPRFMFGTKDGQLWSPGLPKKFESMLSPLSRTTFASPITSITGEKILSPMPNDRMANYPSFGMVLSGAADAIKYPQPVITAKN